MSNCYTAGEGATHHAGCECHEAAHAALVAELRAGNDSLLQTRMRVAIQRDQAIARAEKAEAAHLEQVAHVIRLGEEVERLREARDWYARVAYYVQGKAIGK